jgi:hypothetical protein
MTRISSFVAATRGGIQFGRARRATGLGRPAPAVGPHDPLHRAAWHQDACRCRYAHTAAAVPETWPDPIHGGNEPALLGNDFSDGIAVNPARGGQKTWAVGGSGATLSTSTSMPGGLSRPIVMPGGRPTPGATAAVLGGETPAPQGGQSTGPGPAGEPDRPGGCAVGAAIAFRSVSAAHGFRRFQLRSGRDFGR